MQRRGEKPERLEMLRLRARVGLMELKPFKVTELRLFVEFRFDDGVIGVESLTEGEVVLAGRMAVKVSMFAVFTWCRWFQSDSLYGKRRTMAALMKKVTGGNYKYVVAHGKENLKRERVLKGEQKG